VMEDPRIYRKVANALRERILNGDLKPGDPAPSIKHITEETRYSRQTAGKALRVLEHEGLLIRVPGLGYYVR
jgi:GntR family transcriptional regulator